MKHLSILGLALVLYFTTGAQQHQLWVTTSLGGANGVGAIYVADHTGTNFHIVHDCDMYGSQILGSMTLAPNGWLYGVTETGGTDDSCVVCAFNPLTGEFNDIHDFAFSPDSGESATSGMTLASNGLLYGTTAGGGVNNAGVIYTVDPTTNAYNPIHHFNNDSSGSGPLSQLLQLSNGKLYGTTYAGGAWGSGTIFSFDPLTNNLTSLYSFDGTTGNMPYFGKLIQATDGKLYGMTYNGGASDLGVIYSFNLTGNVYTVIHEFNGTDGAMPTGGLMQATDGNLYGMTSQGGPDTVGVLFKINPVTRNYSVLLNFNELNGASPSRGLSQTSTGKLFGTTSSGGVNGGGVIFSYDIATNTYTKMHEFDTYSGYPESEVYDALTQSPMGMDPVEEEAALSIYPNPATGNVTITVDQSLTGGITTVTDVTGRTITAVTLNSQNTALNTQNFPDGIYFVTVRKNTDTSALKLTVSH